MVLSQALFASNTFSSSKISEDRIQNWAVVDAQKIYRSRKLKLSALRARIRAHGLKSILCLAECSDEEKQVARENGLRYFDLSFNIPDTQLEDAEKIVSVLERSPRPLLIHCRKGADRTGMAATLYFYSQKKMTLNASKSLGLRLRYGHFHTWVTQPIYDALDDYEEKHPHL